MDGAGERLEAIEAQQASLAERLQAVLNRVDVLECGNTGQETQINALNTALAALKETKSAKQQLGEISQSVTDISFEVECNRRRIELIDRLILALTRSAKTAFVALIGALLIWRGDRYLQNQGTQDDELGIWVPRVGVAVVIASVFVLTGKEEILLSWAAAIAGKFGLKKDSGNAN